jgi:hypothetical protein
VSEKRRHDRRRFFAIRRIAPFDGQQIPAEDEFFSVESRDMTSEGFACFMPRRPAFDSMVVAMGGSQDPEFVVADVVHCTDVLAYSSGQVEPIDDGNTDLADQLVDEGSAQRMVLVGCRFSRRL